MQHLKYLLSVSLFIINFNLMALKNFDFEVVTHSPAESSSVFSNSDDFKNEIVVFLKNEFDPNSCNTELCSIMNKSKSDKGNGWHNYTQLYFYLLKNIRHENLNFFELGIGTPATMAHVDNYIYGASLRGWEEFLPNSKIYGADIDKRFLFQTDKIKTFFVDELDNRTIDLMWNSIGNVSFDVILDDGLHYFEANRNFFLSAFDKLKKEGLYIIEDIVVTPENLENFKYFLSCLPGIEYALVTLNNPSNKYDNCVALIKKHK